MDCSLEVIQHYSSMINQQPAEQEEQNEVKLSLLSEQSLYGLYRLEVGVHKYFVKVFPAAKAALCQAELNLLQVLGHQNIIKPLNPQLSLANQLSAILKTDLILFPWATRGNLMNYLLAYGPLPENIERFYLRQVVNGLLHAQKKRELNHPNLTLQNILMDDNRNILLCGWTNSNLLGRKLPFSLADVGITMLVGRSPFVSRDIKNDAYGKLLTDQYIGKFWSQVEKFARRADKNFTFSSKFKEIMGLLLLGKLSNLQQVAQIYLSKDQMSLKEVQRDLEEKEKQVAKRRNERLLRLRGVQSEEQRIARTGNEEQDLSLNRRQSRGNKYFLKEYQNAIHEKITIHPKSSTDKRAYFRLFDNNEKIVLAHLRGLIQETILKQKEGEQLIDPLLLLKDEFCVEVGQSEIKLQCIFELNYNEIEEYTGVWTGVDFRVRIKLAREGDQLCGTIVQVDCPDLNSVCVGRIVLWLKENLQLYS